VLVIVSTSISPYEQLLTGGVVVLCDTASAVIVVVQEMVLVSAIIVMVQKQAHCHPASRGSQQWCRACVRHLVGGQCRYQDAKT
jgi:hypothetical protein